METLYALTSTLGVPLSASIPAPHEAPAGAAETLHGSAVDATLVARFDEREATIELYRVRIRPHRVQRSAAHTKGVTEHLVVFAGAAVVGPSSDPIHVPAGSSGSWAADVPHVYSTLGAEPVEAALLIRYPRVDGHEAR